MKIHHFPLALCCAALLASCASVSRPHGVPLDHPHLAVDGAWYGSRTPARMVLSRHDDDTIMDPGAGLSAASHPYARTQAGVRLRFRTASPRVALRFAPRADGGRMGLRNGFALYADGVRIAVFEQLAFAFDAPRAGPVDYEIVLPSYHAVDLEWLALEPGSALLPQPPDQRPVYVAIGDSITNGLGQQSASYMSYPFLLARGMDWNLVNLGVSGASIGPALAAGLAGRKVDIVTVALGFNDWYWHAESLEDRALAYGRLLDGLRAAQPQAVIVAVTPLASSADADKARAPYALDQLRAAMAGAVARRRDAGDTRLHLLRGEQLSDTAMLMDGIHLSPDGAARYAQTLRGALAPLVPTPRRETP